MRTISATLLVAQSAGFPTGAYQPAVSCLFRPTNTAISGTATYDYSFNPALTTNVVEHIQQVEEPFSDHSVIIINNNTRTVPDLRGYYVDLGWGLRVSSGTSLFGFTQPMWVMNQTLVSGGPKEGPRQLYSLLEMQGIWSAVLNVQPIRYGVSPYFRDEPKTLVDQTIYGCMSILIAQLNLQCGTIAGTASFSLAALGAGDDGIIANTAYRPFPSVNVASTGLNIGGVYRVASTLSSTATTWAEVGAAATSIGTEFIAITTGFAGGVTGTALGVRTPFNMSTPIEFETYGTYFRRLLQETRCTMRAESALVLKIVYAQSTDAADETYYSSSTAGHVFYEAQDFQKNMTPNHIEVIGLDFSVIPPTPTISGDWYDPDDFSGTAYNGKFMPVIKTHYQESLSTSTACSTLAETLGMELKRQISGGRAIIPMDARVELYDKVQMVDYR